MNHHRAEVPQGLTRRAGYLIQMHGLRVDRLDADQCRSSWLEFGIPRAEIDRVVEFDRRWGGLALPPAPFYDGGPRFFRPDTPEGSNEEGWWFEAVRNGAPSRTAS